MATINDIAKVCGISPATVSLVINNSKLKVSPKTRERVMGVVREMNYHPSAHARSLSRGRSNMLGIFTPQGHGLLHFSYYATLISSILDAATDQGQTIALYNGRAWHNRSQRLSVLSDGRCDGMIVINMPYLDGFDDALHAANLPFVAINSGERPPFNSIDIDNIDAGRTGTHHLISLGHKRIAYLHDDSDMDYSIKRLSGYREALDDAEIAYDPNLVLPGHNTVDWSVYLAKYLTESLRHHVTGLVCATDEVAMAALNTLAGNGFNVPRDLSVVGVDDLPGAAYSNPPLTTVRQSLNEVGEKATKLLLQVIDDPRRHPVNIIQPTELVIRKSTCSPI